MSEFKLPFRGFGISGPWGVGKTLMCLDLLVIAKAAGVPKEDLLVIDTHGSVAPYLMLDQYKDIFLYEECLSQAEILKTLTKISIGSKKKVIVIDTVELLQDRLIQEVWEDPSLSDAYKEKMSGILWGRVKKNLLNQVLNLMVRSADSILFTIHTRNEYVGKAPSGRLEAKFLAPIFQLCQAIAILSRRPNTKLPDANFFPPLGKSQFPALPPAIMEFTWPKFFSYMGKTPADWGKLKKEEMVTDGLELLNKLSNLSRGPEEEGEGV